jgi:electron transfer flavoprotein alpha subunit
MKTLIIIEHELQRLKPASLSTIAAGLQLSSELDLLVFGEVDDTLRAQLTRGWRMGDRQTQQVRLLIADDPIYRHPLAEGAAELIARLVRERGYDYVLAPASTFGKNILPRAAALLDVGQLSDVMDIVDASTVKCPMYAGNAIATIQSNDAVKVMTIRATSFPVAEPCDLQVSVETLQGGARQPGAEFVDFAHTPLDRPELTAARTIVAGGRALKTKENFELIEQLADCLHGAVGATRAAVDAGLAPNDYQVGQTGKIVAPLLYIAVGISGAIQHLAGIKDSKVIVAINKDENAPIFQVADYGLVGDLFTIVPELIEALQQS